MTEIINPQRTSSWKQWIIDFDKTYRTFNDNYNALLSLDGYIKSKHPELYPKYSQMIVDGNKHRNTLNKLKSTRDKVLNWLRSIGKLFDTQYFRKTEGLSELGIAPLVIGISIAGASAALIAVGRWIKDAKVMSLRLNELRRLEDKGLTPKQAADILDKTLGPMERALFGIDIKWLVLGGIAIAGIIWFSGRKTA